MPKFWETEEFKKLNAKWNKRLAKAGFDDLEPVEGRLRKRTDDFTRYHKKTGELDYAKEEYFRRAGQFLYEYKFPDRVSKRIWELHARGVPVRGIAARLRNTKHPYDKTKVHLIVQHIAAEMKKKYWNGNGSSTD